MRKFYTLVLGLVFIVASISQSQAQVKDSKNFTRQKVNVSKDGILYKSKVFIYPKISKVNGQKITVSTTGKPVKFDPKNIKPIVHLLEPDTIPDNRKANANVIFYDGFESSNTAFGFENNVDWEIGEPEGIAYDPVNAYTGVNVLGTDLSDDGFYANNINGEYAYTKYYIDCSNYHNVKLSFWRWLSVEENKYDKAEIAVYDGSQWIVIWENPSSDLVDNHWIYQEFDVSQYADGNSDFAIYFYLESDDAKNFGGWNIDDISVTGILNGANTIVAGPASEPDTISSLLTNETDAKLNFDFTITDDGSNPDYDTKNTLIKTLIIRRGPDDQIDNWQMVLGGAELTAGGKTYFGNIYQDSIVFANLDYSQEGDIGYIADNQSKTYTLKVWLKNYLSGGYADIIDNKHFEFEVAPATIEVDADNSSGFASGQVVNSGSTKNKVVVHATELRFHTQPSAEATVGTALPQQPVIYATDVNGNLDQDYSGTVTLTNSGALEMSNNTSSMTNGVASFSSLTFNTGGKFVNLTGTLDTLYTLVPSQDINVDVQPCEIFSENFDSYDATTSLPNSTGDWDEIVYSGHVDWGIEDDNGNKYLTLYAGSSPESYYVDDPADVIAYYTNKIDARGYKDLVLTVRWKGVGEGQYDFGRVVWSTDGQNWSLANSYELSEQSDWLTITYTLSVCDGQQFYIGFLWENDDNTGEAPALTIDEFEIKGLPEFNYNFSYRIDKFNDITGTIVDLDANGGADISLPPGFNFEYNGQPVSVVRVSKNGWLEMGNSITAANDSNELLDPNIKPIVAPLWDKLGFDEQSKIIYRVDGTAPTRVFTVEWRNVIWGGQRQTFQVKLYETSDIVEFWYGNMREPVEQVSASIGINAAGCGVHNRIISITPYITPINSYWSENANIHSVQYLTNGLVYMFNPLHMQEYRSWEEMTLVVGQPDFTSDNDQVDQSTALGANSSAISSKGVLAVGAAYTNRVLIWNSIPTQNGAPADVVLGQTDFNGYSSGVGADKLDEPMGITFSPDGEKLIVADGGNNRVLIWNSIPTSNGQPADVVIGQPDFNTNAPGVGPDKLNRPTGVLVLPDGRLLIADHGNNRVLIFNRIPTENGASADVVIGQKDFNSNSAGSGADELDGPWDVAYSPEGRLMISDDGDRSDGNHRILVFNHVPTTNGESADVVIGNDKFASKAAGWGKSEFDRPSVTCSVEGKLAIADFGNSRVILYNRVPSFNGAPGDFVLGQPYYYTDVPFNDGFNNAGQVDGRNMYYPYSINFDLNGRLYVNGTNPDGYGMDRVMVFGQTPTETADLAIDLSVPDDTYCIYNDVEFTVTLTNNGPDDAYNVTVVANLPLGFQATSYEAGTGSIYNQQSGYWYIPYLAVNQSITLKFIGTIQPDLAGKTITGYAYTIASSQKDNNYSNNADNVHITISPYYAPTIEPIDDQYIERNNSKTINFTVDDKDGLSDISSYTVTSSNQTLIPNSNLVLGGTEPNKTLQITPLQDQYGYSTINIKVSDVHGCHNSEGFLTTVGNIWEGTDLDANPKDWFDANNWAYKVPDDQTEAIIPTTPKGGVYPVISGDASTDDLLIEPKASVTVNNGSSLHIYGKLLIQSSPLGTGSLVDLNTNTNTAIVHDDSVIIERYLTGNSWHYVASPLSAESNKDFTENCAPRYNANLVIYNEAFNSDNDHDGDIDYMDGWEFPFVTPNNGTLQVCRGYAYFSGKECNRIVYQKGDANVALNSGELSITVTNQDGTAKTPGGNPERGWNLIGNPYPSAIDADKFFNENSSVIDQTIYLWDESGKTGFDFEGSDYASYNPYLGGTTGAGKGSIVPDKYISIAQAFFVHKTSSSSTPVSGTVKFDNSMRIAENSFFFKKSTKSLLPRIKLSLTNPDKKYNETIIGFAPDATMNIDPKYDGYKISAWKDFSFYSLADGQSLVNQAIPYPAKGGYRVVHLGFNGQVKGEYKLNVLFISKIDTNVAILLKDNYLDTLVNLRDVNEYDFVNDSEAYINDRFELIFVQDHKPQIKEKVKNILVYEDQKVTKRLEPGLFYDPDENDYLTYTLRIDGDKNMPSWCKFDSKSMSITFAPTNDQVGIYYFTIKAKDKFGLFAEQTFKLTVKNVNDTPIVERTIPRTLVKQGDKFTINLKGVFTDVDRGDKLTYSIALKDGSKLPDWMKLDTLNHQFTGIAKDLGNYILVFTATDKAGAKASTTFELDVVSNNGLNNINGLSVYPNPTVNLVNITTPVGHKVILEDMYGRIIMTKAVNSDITRFNLAHLPAGVYTIQIKDSDGTIIKSFKVTKQ